jgi:hypothetical protein
MSYKSAASAVVMVRPGRFYPNPETASDNAFQAASRPGQDLSLGAQAEFDEAVARLRGVGVTVRVYEDTAAPEKPDAVFPNNWFSTHEDGRVVLYPMFSPTRRAERRMDIIDQLRQSYEITWVIDYTAFETQELYLEGTGSMVLDRVERLAYVSLSGRSSFEPLQRFCSDFDYEPVTFRSYSQDGRPIYHTNVMMCVGTEFALVGLETITDLEERRTVRQRLEASGKTIIELDSVQIEDFAGNALELRGHEERLLVLSSRAAKALTDQQRALVESYARLLPLSLTTIELAGGSARCMLATIHLPPRAT